MTAGWVKLHRCSLNTPELQEIDARGLWDWMLLQAAHKPTRVYRGKGRVRVDLEPGELVMTTRVPGVTQKRVRTLLNRFADAGMIEVAKGHTWGTRVTIKKWSEYQGLDDADTASGHTKGTQGAHEGHTRGTQHKNLKNVKKESPTETPSSTSDDDAFEAFWSEAERKVGKGQARKAFKAATKKADVPQILTAWRLANEQWRRERTDPQYIPHPSTWLNGERWLDCDEARAPPTKAERLARLDAYYQGTDDESHDAQNPISRDSTQTRGFGGFLQLNRTGSGEFGS